MKKQTRFKSTFLQGFIPTVLHLVLFAVLIVLVRKHIIPDATSALLIGEAINLFVLALVLFLTLRRSREEKNEAAMLRSEAQLLQQSYEGLSGKLDEVDKLRHELRNSLALAEGGNDEQAESLIALTQDLDRQALSLGERKYCENTLVNMVINKKAAQAKQNRTQFYSQVHLGNSLGVNDFDLFSCFYNILDNAITANISDCEGTQKWIEIKAEVIGSYLIIKQRNTAFGATLQKENGKFVSTKQERTEHGYGLGIVKDICEKYEGQSVFEHKDNVFYSTLSLKTGAASDEN